MPLQFPLSGSGGANPGKDLQSLLGTPVPLYLSWSQPPNNFDTTAISVNNISSGLNVWDVNNSGPTTSVVTVNSATAPDGSLTASTWVDTTSTANHFAFNVGKAQVFANQTQSPTRMAGIFKANTLTRVVMQLDLITPTHGTQSVSVGYDLAGGAKFDQSAGGSWTIVGTPGTKSLGNSWWLIWFDASNSDNIADNYQIKPKFFLDNGSGAAARSISYTGNGSGIFVWWVNVLPTAGWVPLSTVFYDDFTGNTVDFNNTQNTSLFKWFVKSDWPNVPTSNWGIGANAPATTFHDKSISNSVLTATGAPPPANQNASASNQGTAFLFTAFADPVTPSIVRGFQMHYNTTTFMQCRFAFGPVPFGTGNWPSFWTQMTEGLAGGSAPFGELDFIECLVNNGILNADMGGGSWTVGGGGSGVLRGFGSGGVNGGTGSFPLPTNANVWPQRWHTVSSLYIPSLTNGGSGFGTWVGSIDIQTITGAFIYPSADAVAQIEGQHGPIILGIANVSGQTSAQLWTDYFDYVLAMQ